MIGAKSLSERLRKVAAKWPSYSEVGDILLQADAALDQQAAEIELLKEGRQLHDEHADHLEQELAQQSALIAQAAAALENAACAGVKGAAEALAAIRAKEHP
jgi:hypothetical protein